MKKTWIRVLCLVLLITMLVPGIAVADSYKAKVSSASAKIYEKQNTKSNVVATLTKNATVMVVSAAGEWAKVTYSTKSGFMLLTDLRSTTKKLMYANRATKVYAKPNTGSTVLEEVSVDYPLNVVGMSGNYYMVDDKDGRFTGYINKSHVSETRKNPYAISDDLKNKKYVNGSTKSVMPGNVTSGQYYLGKKMDISKYRAYLVFIAQQKVGCKYSKYGNGSDHTYSNLSYVQNVMKSMNINIPTSISGIAHTGNGAYVSRAELQPGDIVCFDSDDSDTVLVDHIGIYVGSGMFIHASVNANCVVVSSMSSGYYYKNFCWGRRYLTM